ncbi:hypothetical protein [Streptomyces kronopolitis]|uniref:MgtC/SapB family protein n=1 Tax=Streptomyces kronopolitis TaxID=1612435 RepID=UPI003D970A4C
MKFKTEKRERVVQHVVDGIAHDVTEQYDVRIPKLPADWDQRAIMAAVTVVMALTTIAVVWSTFSIGALLQGGVGYIAAAVFDLAWIVNVLMEYLGRFDPKKRKFAKKLGWLLLAATMGAIFWHGLLAGNVALGVVGAAVSLFAKVLWMGIMRFVNADLSARDQQWVEAEASKADAQRAIAGVRRKAARAEQRAALELLAAERTRGEVAEWLGMTQTSAPAAVESSAYPSATSAVSAPSETPAEIASAVRPAPGNPLFKAPDVRADEDGYPAEPVSAQVSTIDNVRSIRPDVRGETDPTPPAAAQHEDQGERVPEQKPRRISIASAVKDALADGATDADYIVRSLGDRFGRTSDPKFAATVKKYVRQANQAKQTDDHTGLYL